MDWMDACLLLGMVYFVKQTTTNRTYTVFVTADIKYTY